MRLQKTDRTFELGDDQGVGAGLALMNPAGTARNVFISPNGSSYLNSGNVGIGTPEPQGNLDIGNDANTATLCLNGSCVQHVPAEVYATIATMQTFHPGCTGGTNTITSDGAFTSWCTSACNRYCASLGYKGGLINEYDANSGDVACGCF